MSNGHSAAKPRRKHSGLDEFVQTLRSLLYPEGTISLGSDQDAWRPATDILKTGEQYLIQLELPGFTAGEIAVEIVGGELSITCERKLGSESSANPPKVLRRERHAGPFARHFRLPEDAKADSVSACMENGVLMVTLDRLTSAKQVTQVNVR